MQVSTVPHSLFLNQVSVQCIVPSIWYTKNQTTKRNTLKKSSPRHNRRTTKIHSYSLPSHCSFPSFFRLHSITIKYSRLKIIKSIKLNRNQAREGKNNIHNERNNQSCFIHPIPNLYQVTAIPLVVRHQLPMMCPFNLTRKTF